MNYSRRGKHRRLWRLAVATHPPIADNLSVPLRGTIWGGGDARTHSGAASQLAVGVRDGDENKQNQVYGLLTRSFL